MIEKKSGDDDVRVVSNVGGYELGDFASGDFVPVNPVVSIKNPGKGAAITVGDVRWNIVHISPVHADGRSDPGPGRGPSP